MSSPRLLPIATLLVVIACDSDPISGASGLPRSSLDLSAEPTTVILSGRVTANVGPPLGVVDLLFRARAIGSGEPIAAGGGHEAFVFGTLIEHSRYRFDQAWTDGDNAAVLKGLLSESTAPGLVNAPLLLRGQTDGALTVTIGPIPGGPFAGQTHVFTGTGTVVIENP